MRKRYGNNYRYQIGTVVDAQRVWIPHHPG